MYKLKMKFLSTEPKTQKLYNKKGSDADGLRRVLLTTQVEVTVPDTYSSVQGQVCASELSVYELNVYYFCHHYLHIFEKNLVFYCWDRKDSYV